MKDGALGEFNDAIITDETPSYFSTRPNWSESPGAPQGARRQSIACNLLGSKRTLEEELIAPFVNTEFYFKFYGEELPRNIDPVLHYARYGWKDRRNPSRGFDTGFYLDTNPDVVVSGVNPLWHYVVAGRDEGRRAVKPLAFARDILRTLKTADERSGGFEVPQTISFLNEGSLVDLLCQLVRSTPFVVSISHDDYTKAVGGTQLLIASEQELFAAMGGVYLHISPLIPKLRLAYPSDAPVILRLILNGKQIGFTNTVELSAALIITRSHLPEQTLFICHCLLGHRGGEVTRLHDALRPMRAFFWLHDYSSLCSSVTLSRNNVAFCGAPPPNSMACQICIYGCDRLHHTAQVRRLFETVDFDVVAPSETALAVWLAHAHVRYRETHVHPHANVKFTAVRRSVIDISKRGTPECPIRVAFAGHGEAHKGWQAFIALINECEPSGIYKFYQFSAEQGSAPRPCFEHVAVEVRASARDTMVRALQTHAIDLVLVLSAWPETFSYVTHEAIAAGADVVTFGDSGNVAAEVIRTGRGLVMRNFTALLEFFVTGSAARYVRLCYDQGNQSGDVMHHGTTATLWTKIENSLRSTQLRLASE